MKPAGGRIGFLHTAAAHRDTFAALTAAAAPGADQSHVVDPSLLERARREGDVAGALRADLFHRLVEAASGCAVVLCTCSTLGPAAEGLSPRVGVPVLRVDRPMARRAVAIGSRIAVVVALESAWEPIRALLGVEGSRAGRSVHLRRLDAGPLWSRFERGDMDGYLDGVAALVDGHAGDAEVVVLAQASMAAAADRCAVGVPVLSSPAAAVEAAVAELDRPKPPWPDAVRVR